MSPQRHYWALDWLISQAFYWHEMSALAIALAVSKLLLSEELAALPSLAWPLHRLVKDGCWGSGRRPAEYSSDWQGHSGSVVCFPLHTQTHTPSCHYFSSETWLQPAEKLEIRCVCLCLDTPTIIVRTKYSHDDRRRTGGKKMRLCFWP